MLRKQLRRDQMAALFANLAVRDRSEAYGMCLSLGDKGAHV